MMNLTAVVCYKCNKNSEYHAQKTIRAIIFF